jgi:hypothetical protein
VPLLTELDDLQMRLQRGPCLAARQGQMVRPPAPWPMWATCPMSTARAG